MFRIALSAVLFVVSVGCARGVGEYCAASNECGGGTQCVLSGSQEIVDGGLSCNDTKKLCSVTCSTDTECTAALGKGHICVKECFQGSCLQGSH